MKEELLHHIWKTRAFQPHPLISTDGQHVDVLKPGQLNPNSGPDFLNARLKIGDTEWVGNVEMHLRSSDWFTHAHQADKAYNTVVLHVVYLDDLPKDKLKIPTLELSKLLPDSLFKKYQQLLENPHYQFIPCETHFAETDEFKRDYFLERLVLQKIESKAEKIQDYWQKSRGDWEETSLRMLAYSFGLKVNASAFEMLFDFTPFRVIAKLRHSEQELKALLIGQAGLLNKLEEAENATALAELYAFQKQKFNLVPMPTKVFRYSRLMPPSFPHRRLFQLAEFLARHASVFELIQQKEYDTSHLKRWLMNTNNKHQLTDSFVDRLIINCFLPIKLFHAKQLGKDIEPELFSVLENIKPENNAVIRGYKNLGMKVVNAKNSQSLLELNKSYCKNLNCLNCTIGNEILKHV